MTLLLNAVVAETGRTDAVEVCRGELVLGMKVVDVVDMLLLAGVNGMLLDELVTAKSAVLL